ncbi:MAG: AI-2E family transporter [Solirubrobacteraceae bacterium]
MSADRVRSLGPRVAERSGRGSNVLEPIRSDEPPGSSEPADPTGPSYPLEPSGSSEPADPTGSAAPSGSSWTSFAPALAYRAVVLAFALVAIGLVFKQLVGLLLALTISVIIAMPVAAGATWLGRFRVPRPLGAVLSLLLGFGVIAALLVLVLPSFVHQAGTFVHDLPRTVSRLEHSINSTFGLKAGTIARAAQRFADRYTQHPATLLGPLSSIGVTLASGLTGLVVILISALYMAINPVPLIRGLVRLAPPGNRAQALWVFERIRSAWLGWLRGIALDMLVLGGLLFIGLRIIGVNFAVGFAVFSALLTVIPNYGSVISAVPPIVYGLAHSFHEGVLVAVVYIVVNQIEGNLVLPIIMARSVSLHPATIAIGVLIAGGLLGVPGLFLSVPLISLTLILVDELWIRPQEARDEGPPRSVHAAPLDGA